MVEIEPSSRLYVRQGALFMTASVIHGITDGKPDTDPVSFILTDKLLVTVRYVDPLPFIMFVDHLCAEPELAKTRLSILVRLLDAIVDRLADELEATAQRHRDAVGASVRARARAGAGKRKDRAAAGDAAAADRRGSAAAGGNPRIGAQHRPAC